MPFPRPDNEQQRLAAPRSYHLLDTPDEHSFDDFVKLASYVCEVPIALISLLDEDRQWFKAKVGLEAEQTPREFAFCAHTIMSSDVTMVVEDARMDQRFVDNPLVCGAPHIRFYAGVPLTDPEGFSLGTLCVIDSKPRQISDSQQEALEALARQLVTLCRFRRSSAELAGIVEDVEILRGLLPICSYCKDVRNDKGYWRSVEEYFSRRTDASFTHSICPDCYREHYPELQEGGQGDAAV